MSEGRANIWDDSDVQRRLAELGIQTPQSTQAEPADVAQDTAPAVKEAEGDMAEGDNQSTFVEELMKLTVNDKPIRYPVTVKPTATQCHKDADKNTKSC
jgi:hypothetical protein